MNKGEQASAELYFLMKTNAKVCGSYKEREHEPALKAYAFVWEQGGMPMRKTNKLSMIGPTQRIEATEHIKDQVFFVPRLLEIDLEGG